MSLSELNDTMFNRFTVISEREAREAAISADQAFVAAINREIRRGKLKVTAGTFVDTSPPIYARRLYGMLPMSACGSPAQMCMEASGQPNGAEAMK